MEVIIMTNNERLVKNLDFLASMTDSEEIRATMEELIPVAQKIDFDHIDAFRVSVINNYMGQVLVYIVSQKTKAAQDRAESLRQSLYRAAGMEIPVPEIVQLW